MTKAIGVTFREGVTTITLQAPKRRNALSLDMLTQLHDSLVAVADDNACRAIILTGDQTFSAGQDIAEIQQGLTRSVSAREHLIQHYLPVLETMVKIPKPIIATIRGYAAGAGLSLALAADIRIASDTAYFRTGFTSIGLVPDVGISFLLPRIVGLGRATAMMLLDREISAAEATAAGLILFAVNDSLLDADALRVASDLAQSAHSVSLTKRLLGDSVWDALRSAFDREASYQNHALASDDAREGIAAFLEHRAPIFSGS